MPLSLKINGTSHEFSELEICSAKISRKNAACDELSLSMSDISGANAFSYGDIVEVFDGSTRKFYGKIRKLPVRKSGVADRAEIAAANPWRELESIIYQQSWTMGGGASTSTVSRSKVVLGQSSDGSQIGTAAQLSDIFAYAISRGAHIQIGTISADSAMLLDEYRDLSCAEAAARVVKWIPDASVFFDYSGSGYPSINVIRTSQLNAVSVDIADGSLKSVSVAPRPDLAVSGVIIKYETENTENGQTYLSLSEDSYPAGAHNAENEIVMSVDLDGYRTSCASYKIECETILPSSVDWWRSHAPSLADIENITVLSYGRDSGNLSHELKSGTIVDGMNFQSERDRVFAEVRYEKDDGTIVEKTVAVKLTSTNAASGTYYVWSTSRYAETRPEGLAQAVYNAASGLRYEGSVQIVGGAAENFVGKKINIIDASRTDWASINSPVVSTEEDLSKNILSVKFGPPKHLYPDDISELFRINRTRVSSVSASSRASGRVSANTIEVSGESASSYGSEGDPKYNRLVIIETESENSETRATFDLNPSDIGSSEYAKMREVLVCKDGYAAKAKMLITEPVFLTQC